MKRITQKQAIEKLGWSLLKFHTFKFDDIYESQYFKWYRDTKVLLKSIFGDNSDQLQEFEIIVPEPQRRPESANIYPVERNNTFFDNSKSRSEALFQSMLREIKEYWDHEKSPLTTEFNDKDIFIVHGHDMGKLDTLARFIDHLNLNPIVLHEQPNTGFTIIEKLEKYSKVSYAIILMTPDDIRSDAEKNEFHKCARQNVILELGFFMGMLERKNTCAIYIEGVELPSDYLGMVYIPFDEKGAWKMKLAKELKSAGFNIDLNNIL